MTKTYILQKDLPNAKAGSLYQQTECGKEYVCYDLMSNGSWDVTYPKYYIENNPEWFKEKKPSDVRNTYEAAKYMEWLLKDIYKYTEEDMRKCFEKSREMATPRGFLYLTFEDYIKTVKRM